MKAKHAMTRDVVCVQADDSLQTAAEVMQEWGIRHLPVIDGEHLIGIVSDRDILLHTSITHEGKQVVDDCDVGEVMTRSPVTCGPGETIESITATMLDRKIDCLPVVASDSKLVGLITSADLLEMLRRGEAFEAGKSIPWSYQLRLRDSSGYGKYHIE